MKTFLCWTMLLVGGVEGRRPEEGGEGCRLYVKKLRSIFLSYCSYD